MSLRCSLSPGASHRCAVSPVYDSGWCLHELGVFKRGRKAAWQSLHVRGVSSEAATLVIATAEEAQ